MIASSGPDEQVVDPPTERRRHRRLAIRLPLECVVSGGGPHPQLRAITQNISTGGVFFEAPASLLRPGADVDLALTVPPGEGYSPYAGRVHGAAEILRVEPLTAHQNGSERVGIAARFREELQLVF
jgi:hypothetical protein